MNNKARRLKKNNKKIKKTKKFKKIILNLLEIFFICMMIFSGRKIYFWWKDNYKSKLQMDTISDAIVLEKGDYKVDIQKLKEMNPDTVGWIKVKGTQIDYPVVKTTNNDYYLYHSFDRSENGAGWIFMNCINNIDMRDTNTVIFGHNRRDNSMFATLKNTLKPEWYNVEDNKKIKYIDEEGEKEYKVFSVYSIEKEDYYINNNFKNNIEIQNFIDKIKERSVTDFKQEVTTTDKILTLSTCANDNKYRVVLHAKKIAE